MIENLANSEVERLFQTGKFRRLPSEILRRALMCLTQLHTATDVEDLRLPPSNHLESLRDDCAGQWSIRTDHKWRVCFHFEAGNAHDVDIVTITEEPTP